MAWLKSTGATGDTAPPFKSAPPRVMSSSASGSVAFSSRMNSRRLTVGASAARWRQTRTMLDARALVPEPIMRLPSSVRMGQVPVRAKPACNTASRNVTQPVLWVPLSSCVSLCLKA